VREHGHLVEARVIEAAGEPGGQERRESKDPKD
jgi:hypothetical protein